VSQLDNSQTAWIAGRLDARSRTQRLLFGRMYEDSEIERGAFCGKGRVFCIASAGSTALQLAAEHDVVACDINPAQLAYAERRARGEAAETGDAERFMNFARSFAPLIGWRRKVVQRFLTFTHAADQLDFWREHLDTRRFRAAFDTLVSPLTLRAVYAPGLLSFLPDRFGAVLRKRLETGFAHHANAQNPYARALLLGESTDTTPETAAAQNIHFVLGDAASVLESCAPRSFDGFALSNILDGAEPAYRERLISAIRSAASSNAVAVLRSFAEPPRDLLTNRAAADRSLLWGVVDVRPAHAL
jgi:S-adenosylmethionine:diacylglycerol 3-amino-3-carboxypropyl transferase